MGYIIGFAVLFILGKILLIIYRDNQEKKERRDRFVPFANTVIKANNLDPYNFDRIYLHIDVVDSIKYNDQLIWGIDYIEIKKRNQFEYKFNAEQYGYSLKSGVSEGEVYYLAHLISSRLNGYVFPIKKRSSYGGEHIEGYEILNNETGKAKQRAEQIKAERESNLKKL